MYTGKWKESVEQDYILFDSNYIRCKRQNYRESKKKIIGHQACKGRREGINIGDF